MSLRPNEVTIFSNGMADFRRRYLVKKGDNTTISLAYRRDYIGDVLGSLNVFGSVRVVKPPAYRYTNDNKATLSISNVDALPTILQSFSGAKVSLVTRGNPGPIIGTIMGLDSVVSVVENRQLVTKYLSVKSDKNVIKRIPLSDINSYEFVDDTDNAEIDKALSRNYQAIKPQSTFVDLVLTASDNSDVDAEAVIQSVLPLAAWKMVYRLQCRGDKVRLEGHAVVDNNTDEDLKNFMVNVVTGDPNTFRTDLATAKTPRRNLVNLVPDSAYGGFLVSEGEGQEEDFLESAGGSSRGMGIGNLTDSNVVFKRRFRPVSGVASAATYGNSSNFAMSAMSVEGVQGPQGPQGLAAAEHEEAEASTVGEFQLFRSRNPVDIPAQSSALVAMFGMDLGHSRTILIYNENEMPSHPFRAIRFVNDTGLNLSKGNCTVFRDDVWAGQGIIDNAKPDDVRVVPHALENGVRVTKEIVPPANRLVRIKIADNMVFQESAFTSKVSYKVRNKLGEDFKMILEHTQVIPNSDVKVAGMEVTNQEKIPGGVRFEITLPAKARVEVSVLESRIDNSTLTLSENTLLAYQGKERIAENVQVATAMGLQELIAETKRKLSKATQKRNDALAMQDRVKGLIAPVSKDSSQYNVWMSDLAESEQTIRELDRKTIPDIQEELEENSKKLQDALKKIKADWEDQKVLDEIREIKKDSVPSPEAPKE